MANVTVSVPDAIAPRVVVAMKEDNPDIDFTGMTQLQTAKACIRAYMKRTLIAHEGSAAALAMRNAMQQSVIDAQTAASADADTIT